MAGTTVGKSVLRLFALQSRQMIQTARTKDGAKSPFAAMGDRVSPKRQDAFWQTTTLFREPASAIAMRPNDNCRVLKGGKNGVSRFRGAIYFIDRRRAPRHAVF
jgi:hypothetical protein